MKTLAVIMSAAMMTIGMNAEAHDHTIYENGSAELYQADFVNGHFRNDGTYISPYYRGPSDGLCYNNKRGC